jgi:hypothetical protein
VLYTLTPRGRELVEALLQPAHREVAV